jgi:type II secretion system protein H
MFFTTMCGVRRATGGARKAVVVTNAATAAPGGFTLIEMLIVVVVIAALSTALVASLAGRVDRRALDMAAKDLTAALQYAARQSRLSGLPHRIVIDESDSQFHIEQAASPTGREYAAVTGLPGRTRALGPGVTLDSVLVNGDLVPAQRSIDFGPEGGFEGQILLRNRKGQTLGVSVLAGQCCVAQAVQAR